MLKARKDMATQAETLSHGQARRNRHWARVNAHAQVAAILFLICADFARGRVGKSSGTRLGKRGALRQGAGARAARCHNWTVVTPSKYGELRTIVSYDRFLKARMAVGRGLLIL